MIDDAKALGAIAATASTVGGSIPITITSTAPGLMGVLGLATTTTVVALPVGGIIAAGGLLCYGAYKMSKLLK